MSKQISAQQVMDLRKRISAGLVQCKEALQEADGDMEKAIHILRKKGVAFAVNKRGRETNEGLIAYGENHQKASLIEVRAETDFVVENARFKEFAKNICEQILQSHTQSVEELLKQQCSKHPSLTIEDYRAEVVHTLGENIQIKRILQLAKEEDQSLGIYSHMGGKIVAVVILQGDSDLVALAREIAMHVAAAAPDFLRPEDVSQDVLSKEEEIIRSQIKNKPLEVVDKIIQGKINTFYEQSCLIKQKYVKEPSINVEDFVAREGKKMGKELTIARFVRWQIGEVR